jgi:hypothetical protein
LSPQIKHIINTESPKIKEILITELILFFTASLSFITNFWDRSGIRTIEIANIIIMGRETIFTDILENFPIIVNASS